MTDITTEVFYRCSVEGCTNCVFEEMFVSIGCAVHGQTLTKVVRTFQDGKLLHEKPTQKERN